MTIDRSRARLADGACPVCGSATPSEFLRREGVPVHQNLPLPTQGEARRIARGTLAMRACGECGFVYNAEFDAAKLSYGASYDNTQDCSPAFEGYLEELARWLVEGHGVRGARIVEVGCGKGAFLRRLVGWPGAGNSGIGYDPSYTGPESALGGRVRFVRDTYGPAAAAEAADVIVCRHVIEHVADPVALLESVAASVRQARAPLLFFETPCVEWILRNEVIWDFFYEHCSLFDEHSLARAFAAAGFELRSVEHAFGRQYLWAVATTAERASRLPRRAGEVAALAKRYARDESARIAGWRAGLERLAGKERVALWGAGAKGCTLASLIDPACELVDCLIDINPGKQGRFVPGTGHPIVAPREIPARGVTRAVAMNPNYRDEIQELLRREGIAVALSERI